MSYKIIFSNYDAIHFIKVAFFLAAPYLNILVNIFMMQMLKKNKIAWANLKDRKVT